MGRRTGRSGSGWLLPLALLVLIALVAGGGAAWLALREPVRAPDPQAFAGTPAPGPSPRTSVPEPSRGPLLASSPGAPAPTSVGLARVVAQALRQPALGGRIAAAVVDARTGEVLLDNRGAVLVTPASTTKIATAVAALTVLKPDDRLSTRVVAGAAPGQVVLVGGGDATLVGSRKQAAFPQRATLAQLAAQVRTALAGAAVTSVVVDTSLYEGPALGPGWKPGYVSGGDVAPVSALLVDGGRTSARGPRSLNPAVSAGQRFAAALGVPKAPVTVGRAAPEAVELGAVQGPTISQLVEIMLSDSDNDVAESLARQVAIARGVPASFASAAAAVDATLDEVLPGSMPAEFSLQDGSGLSRNNRLSPLALSRLLSLVASDESGRLRTVLVGLPIAGFDGTLARRYRSGPAALAAGTVRGKTGTLNGVSALSGLVRTAEGRLLAFDLTADAVPPGANAAAAVALDNLTAAFASCGCR